MLLCHVLVQIGLLMRSIATYGTAVWTFTCVLSLVNLIDGNTPQMKIQAFSIQRMLKKSTKSKSRKFFKLTVTPPLSRNSLPQ